MLLAFQWLEDLLHKLITRAPRWLQCGRNNGSVVSLMLRGHSIFLERLFFFFFFFLNFERNTYASAIARI